MPHISYLQSANLLGEVFVVEMRLPSLALTAFLRMSPRIRLIWPGFMLEAVTHEASMLTDGRQSDRHNRFHSAGQFRFQAFCCRRHAFVEQELNGLIILSVIALASS